MFVPGCEPFQPSHRHPRRVATGLSGSDPIAGWIMTAVGVLFLVLAVIQQRAEAKH